MRGRWLKPEFFRDRKIGQLGVMAALVFQALWCMADDSGVAPCDPDRIKGEMFFAWSEVLVPEITGAVLALSEARRIQCYKVGDDAYCRIVNFTKHQVVHKPSKFRYPKESQADSAAAFQQCGTGEALVTEKLATPHILDTKTPIHLKSTPAPPDERITEVLAHYEKLHPRRHPNAKDRSAIKRALTHYAVTELCQAIDGNAADPWHADRSKHELTYVLRDSGKIDQFIALATKPAQPSPQSSNGTGSKPDATAARAFDEAMRLLRTTPGGWLHMSAEQIAAVDPATKAAVSAAGGWKELANSDEIGLRIKRKLFIEAYQHEPAGAA